MDIVTLKTVKVLAVITLSAFAAYTYLLISMPVQATSSSEIIAVQVS